MGKRGPAQKTITFTVDERGCHICTSHSVGTWGYPLTKHNGVCMGVHRYLYQQKHGALPSHILVRHTCDNRMCINLDHLEPGTHQDNMKDRDRRGRRNSAYGENCPSAKLSRQQVLEIIAATDTQENLVKTYKISRTQIHRIRSGAKWRMVHDAGRSAKQ